ncbi:leukocyte receptor cluster member 1-like [Asterias amurensis]|uniref:leukocyte receptor cluster member 1-like n=1 Tax=Asterias amurensis TaxID=7602 RepID=UPI003AB5B08A
MNILPKKSWHVRSYKNIERVKRDEAQAAAEAKESQNRAALAEQEARTALLRSKARNQLTSIPHDEECLAVQTTTDNIYKHVDLFTDLSSSKPQGEKNKEHEQEVKAAQEKYEKSIGLLTYLGQSSTEAQTTKPWYFKPPNRGSEKDNLEQSCTDVKRKGSLDPMMEMERYLGVKERPTIKPEKTVDVKRVVSPGGILSYCSTTGRHSTKRRNHPSSDDKKRKHHKHTHKSRHKHKSKTDKKESSRRRERGLHHDMTDDNKKCSHCKGDKVKCKEKDYQGPNIQQLRAERLKREAEERLKTSRLLSGQKIAQTERLGPKEDIEDKPGHYNSQFHPELVCKKHKPFQFNMI